MQCINRVEILGYLGADPKQRYTNGSGKPVVSFSVATSDGYTTKDGEIKEFTEWHRVVVFSEGLGSLIMQRLQAGSLVLVEGQKRTREYTNKDGVRCRDCEIVIRPFKGSVNFLDSKADAILADLAKNGFPLSGEDHDFDDDLGS